jgi:hypothetical protein
MAYLKGRGVCIFIMGNACGSVNDATVVVVGGGTSETSGEGIDRASLGLPGTQLAFLQAVRAAAIAAKKPLATVVVQV